MKYGRAILRFGTQSDLIQKNPLRILNRIVGAHTRINKFKSSVLRAKVHVIHTKLAGGVLLFYLIFLLYT
jgi:hypothetical protein